MKFGYENISDPVSEDIAAKEFWSMQTSQQLEYPEESHVARVLCELAVELQCGDIFEFGCAAGRNLNFLREELKHRKLLVTASGIDINQRAIELGRRKFGLDLSLGDENDLKKYGSNSFDLVFTVSVLDHMPDPMQAIQSLMATCRGVGVFFEPSSEQNESSAKALGFEAAWWQLKDQEPFPFTYFHNYDDLFKSASCSVLFKQPLPTHIDRSGPFYNI